MGFFENFTHYSMKCDDEFHITPTPIPYFFHKHVPLKCHADFYFFLLTTMSSNWSSYVHISGTVHWIIAKLLIAILSK